MKNIILGLSFLLVFFYSCKGQDKESKNETAKTQKSAKHIANCNGNYSTGEKLTDKDKKWSLTSKDIDTIMKLSNEITENEWHFSYPITPCNIEVKDYIYNGKKIDLLINGGSFISFVENNKNIILGCALPECSKYFLKAKEDMSDVESDSEITSNSEEVKKYKIDFNGNNLEDLLLIKNDDSGINLEAQTDKRTFLKIKYSCDFLDVNTKPKNNQTFNLIIGYSDQYKKTFRKVVIPVFYKKNDLFIDKIFISTFGTNAKTGNEEWLSKEIKKSTSLRSLDLDAILSQ